MKRKQQNAAVAEHSIHLRERGYELFRYQMHDAIEGENLSSSLVRRLCNGLFESGLVCDRICEALNRFFSSPHGRAVELIKAY